jgi:diguanylate cyclase (GGDEF)-like protein
MMPTEATYLARHVAAPSTRAKAMRPDLSPAVSGHWQSRQDLPAAAFRHIDHPRLRSILGKLKEAIIWSLVDQANQPATDFERNQVTADLFALNRWTDRFEDELLERLCAVGHPAPGGPADCSAGCGEEEELSLVDDLTLERSLEAKKLATHLADHFRSQLTALEELFQAEAGQAPTHSVQDLPIAPCRIAEALSKLAAAMDIGPSSLRLAFGAARPIFDRELGALYEDLFASIGGQGAAHKGCRSGFGHRQLSKAGRSADPSNDAGEKGSDTERTQHSDPPVAADCDSSPVCARDASPEIQPSLTSLWQELGSVANLSPADLIEALERAARARGFKGGLERDDRQRARLATELWELVHQEASRSSTPDSWRQQLQLPLLATASADPEFFVQEDHPLRVLLDRLDEIGGLVETAEDAGLTRSVRDSVEHLLGQINSSTMLDRRLLDQLADAIGEVAERQRGKYHRNLERVVKTCAGRDRLRHCRERVQSELDRRYAGKQLPAAFDELLSAGWQTLLEISLLKQGEGGLDCRSHLETLDLLVQRLGGEPHVISTCLPEADVLLGRINAGLEFAAADPRCRAALLGRLGRLLAEASTEPPRLAPYSRRGGDREVPLAPEGVEPAEWGSALQRANSLKVGDLVVLTNAPGGRQRLKTAWVGEEGWLYAFVDERGFKAADLTPGQLATKLVSGQVALESAERRPLSERAIDRMLDDFRQRVEQQAEVDPLTGLSNPSRFQAHLARTLMDVGNGISNCLIWIDIDQFTVVRNTFGLEAADQLRATIARLLKQRLAGKGMLAFLGGDQYAATLKRCEREHAMHLADELRQAVSDLAFAWDNTKVPTAVSIGVIDLGEINTSCAAVLQAADATVFAAKREGGNRCLLYNGDNGVINRRKTSMEWLRRVDQVLDRGQLDLRCQRIAPVDPRSALRPHYELLLGVRDEEEKSLDISQFIAAAESYHRMSAVDRWVARTAFQWAAEHPIQLERMGGIAINLSGQSMNDEGIVDFLRELFSETGVSPDRISFEATETAAITHLGRASHIVRAIKSMGCAFALDDFGSGFSSYSYLKQLPVDWLKIDGAFVRGIHQDPADYGVVKSIHEIAHFMGKKTIAEYVEDDAILLKLREIGVDYAQGYRIEKPWRLAGLV